MKRLLARRALALGAAVIVAFGAQLVTAPSANAANPNCSMRITNPNQISVSAVYSVLEVNCDQDVAFIGGYFGLYRNGTLVGSGNAYVYSDDYAYDVILADCLPGSYQAKGTTFANFNGGLPEITRTFVSPLVTLCT